MTDALEREAVNASSRIERSAINAAEAGGLEPLGETWTIEAIDTAAHVFLKEARRTPSRLLIPTALQSGSTARRTMKNAISKIAEAGGTPLRTG